MGLDVGEGEGRERAVGEMAEDATDRGVTVEAGEAGAVARGVGVLVWVGEPGDEVGVGVEDGVAVPFVAGEAVGVAVEAGAGVAVEAGPPDAVALALGSDEAAGGGWAGSEEPQAATAARHIIAVQATSAAEPACRRPDGARRLLTVRRFNSWSRWPSVARLRLELK